MQHVRSTIYVRYVLPLRMCPIYIVVNFAFSLVSTIRIRLAAKEAVFMREMQVQHNRAMNTNFFLVLFNAREFIIEKKMHRNDQGFVSFSFAPKEEEWNEKKIDMGAKRNHMP